MAALNNRPDGARYLYAIVPSLDDGGLPGPLGDDVYLIHGGQFAAVVKDATENSYVRRDRQELVRLLLAHQQVIEQVMAWVPVLPVKFATTVPDGESVLRCLESGAAAFANAFAKVRGKTQFEVLVTWDLEAVFAEIASDPEVIRLKALSVDDGACDLEASARLGALVKRTLDQRREELGKTILDSLRETAVDAIDNALMDDRMVLNLALLIEDDRIAAFDHCLATLDAVHGGKLTFRCVGPLPPHSFATVEVSFLDPGEVVRARKVLELDAVLDAETVRAAYRRLAKHVHPDTSADHENGERIIQIREAFTTLSSYLEAGGPVVVAVGGKETALGADML